MSTPTITDSASDQISQADFIERVLRCFSGEATSDLLWHVHEDGLRFAVMCSDVFWWGTADAEELSPATLPALEEALHDLAQVGLDNTELATLYCSRQRGIRPQGAMYTYVDPAAWPLLDAAGPARETGLLNPRPRPEDADENVVHR